MRLATVVLLILLPALPGVPAAPGPAARLVAGASAQAPSRPRPGTARAARTASERYTAVRVDAQQRLVITTGSGRTIVVPRTTDQTTFANPMISSDGTAVGAQGQFGNCCTSYDIPLQLVVYRRGVVHRFTGVGLPIFQWHFADAGSRVAYSQQTVHGACVITYELRDIDSERLIDSTALPEPCGMEAADEVHEIPLWVTRLLEDPGSKARP